MFKLIVLSIFWATILTDYVAFGNVKSSKNGIKTIIRGKSVLLPHPYNHQVSLRLGLRHICGGSIIHKRKVLTAAHCIDKQATQLLNIVVGTRDLLESGKNYTIKTVYVHETYNSTSLRDDIALLTTDTDIEFNDRVGTIKLYNGKLGEGKICTAIGWGRWNISSNTLANTLQELNTTTMSFAGCSYTQYNGSPFLNYTKQICVYQGPGVGLCIGDSGGPLIYNKQLVGITSWARGCAIGYPDVFTRVNGYKSWINSKKFKTRCIP